MTLVETMIATGLAGLVLAGIMSFSTFTARSFASMGNYCSMNSSSRLALDEMSKEIRQTDFLTNYTETSLVFQTTDPVTSNTYLLSYTYDPDARTLTRTLNGTSRVLLTGCSSYHFDLYQRNPVLTNGGDLVALISTNQPRLVKAIDLSWVCSRSVLGRFATTEDDQSERVVIRND